MKRSRILAGSILAIVGLWLAGCETQIHNLTPAELTQNTSGLYTFSFSIGSLPSNVDPASISAEITINGDVHPMEASTLGDGIWSFDFALPPNQQRVRYFYTLYYTKEEDDGRRATKVFTPRQVYESRVLSDYVVGLEADRAPVGATVKLFGRNLTPDDRLAVGGSIAQTRFLSESAIEFTVPAVPAGQAYDLVRVRPDGREELVGVFRVDRSRMQVLPGSLSLGSGERQMLVFAMPSEAPVGGLYIEVTTDVPDSVIMPEVIIPAGARSVNVQVEGATPGTGTLFVESAGYRTEEIPVTVF